MLGQIEAVTHLFLAEHIWGYKTFYRTTTERDILAHAIQARMVLMSKSHGKNKTQEEASPVSPSIEQQQNEIFWRMLFKREWFRRPKAMGKTRPKKKRCLYLGIQNLLLKQVVTLRHFTELKIITQLLCQHR